MLLRVNWLMFTQYFKHSKIWSNFHIVHPQDTDTDCLWSPVNILWQFCVLNIIRRRDGRHAGNYSRNRGHMVAVACSLPAFYQQYPTASSVVPSYSSSWIMQVSRLSLNQCDLFWWVVRSVVVGSYLGKGMKIVNAHKKKVLLWGASWRAVSLWPHDACSELHSPGSLQQAIWAACRYWRALWGLVYKWCYFEYHYVTLRLSGSCRSKVLVIAWLWEPKGRSPQKARQRCARDSSPGLIPVGVLSVPHETDTEAASKAQPLDMKYIILGQWLTCPFSTDLTIYVTPLLVNIFNAWGHLLPNWPLCPQMLLISLPCRDAQVLQWDHTPTGVLHGWMILCWLWLCLCMLWSLRLQADDIFLRE